MRTKKLLIVGIFAGLMLTLTAGSLLAGPTVYPLGVTINEPGASNSLIFYTSRVGVPYLIDRSGAELHSWSSPQVGWTINYAKPLNNGNISVLLAETGTDNNKIVELDRDSNIVREWIPPVGAPIHHDHQVLSNGRVLILCNRFIDVPSISDKELDDDCLIMLNPDSSVRWDWQTADHFDEFGFTDAQKEGIFEKGGDWAHANSAHMIPQNTSHTDPRFKPGNIVVSYRFISTVAIIDPRTDAIEWVSQPAVGQHNAKVLPNSLPGGGNMMIFDNGVGDSYTVTGRGWSRILEIDLTTDETVWEYTATMSDMPNWTFDSWFISGMERQPNGNTVICEGAFGRIFEVTPEGEIVWEYVSPHIDLAGDPPTNRIYRAHTVSPNWF